MSTVNTWDVVALRLGHAGDYEKALALAPHCSDPAFVFRTLTDLARWRLSRTSLPFLAWLLSSTPDAPETFARVGDGTHRTLIPRRL